MEARGIALVQDSFEKVSALGLQAAEIFYAELFAIDPSLRAMFSDDLEDQQKKLMAALSLVVRSLHTPEKITGTVEKLAVKHLDYGVKPEHYTYVGNALLRTLKKGLGAEFTPELCDAWTDAFRMLARIMKEAAYGRAPAMLRAAG
ncbi:MAG: globin family protein [Pseudolabrys sp.]